DDVQPVSGSEPIVVMAASDPANPYPLAVAAAVESRSVDLARRRSRGALLATRAGEIILVAEGRGRRLTVRPGANLSDLTEVARALAQRLVAASDGRRDPTIETIDGVSAAASPYVAGFVAA